MANIASFILCDTVNNIQNQAGLSTPSLISPTLVLRPEFIPSSYSFGVAFGIADVEMDADNFLSCVLRSPNGEEIQKLEGPMPNFEASDVLPQKFRGYMVTFDIRNVALKEEGCYSLEISVNGEIIDTKDIPVYKRA